MNTAAKLEPSALPAAPIIPIPGTFMPDQGGHFVGIVRVGEHRYGVIVSPAAGDFKGPWGEYGKKIGATSLSDGLANTQAMSEAGSPIAQTALSLSINDQSDWYIPSRDELELAYRHLKPTTQENWCSFRDGENPCSDPIGMPYTEQDPAQTETEAFRAGAPDAFHETWYWSSTQYSAYGAFSQGFRDGGQSRYGKYDEWRVRAVRRFLID